MILSIETATNCGSVSLTRGVGADFHLLAEYTSQPDITHSRRLLGSIDYIMKGVGVHWSDLDAVAVSTGPGSFTGLRIGMAAAKSIAMARQVSLVGIPTLDALAQTVGVKNKLLCCMLDARKQQVYAGFYRTDESGMAVRLSGPMVIDPHKLFDEIEEPIILVGSGVEAYWDCFKDNQHVERAQDYRTLPRAMYIGLLAADKLMKGEVLDPVTASPVYVRASEAEVNLKRKQLEQNQGKCSVI